MMSVLSMTNGSTTRDDSPRNKESARLKTLKRVNDTGQGREDSPGRNWKAHILSTNRLIEIVITGPEYIGMSFILFLSMNITCLCFLCFMIYTSTVSVLLHSP